VTSERKLVMELQCNMALRWFVRPNRDEQPWDASTFSQNRRRRFDEAGLLERVSDDAVKRALAEGVVSRHVSADGTLVRANASYESFVPLEEALDPDEYKRRLRADDRRDPVGPQDPGNRAVNFRGERRPRAKRRLGFTPTTLGGDTGFFSAGFIEALLGRGIEPHIAVDPHGQQPGMRASGCARGGWGTGCPNGPARRSRNSSARARTGMGCAGSGDAGRSASGRRRT
jgi:hypothetical protein